MAGLGIRFEGDFQQMSRQSSRMGRTKSMPAFHHNKDLGQSKHPTNQSQCVQFALPETRPSTKRDQARYDEPTEHSYIPTGDQTWTATNPGHHDQYKDLESILYASKKLPATPRIQLHPSHQVSEDKISHPPMVEHLSLHQSSKPSDPNSNQSNLVGPGTLYMRRLESAKARVAQKQEELHSHPLRPVQSMPVVYDGYLGAGMMAAAMRGNQGPPSLELLRAIALRGNSPSLNTIPYSEAAPFTSPSTGSPARTPNSPSRLPAFLQNRQNRDGLSPINASPRPYTTVPNSPLNPRRSQTLPQSSISPVFNLQMPPIDCNMMQRTRSAAEATETQSRHRPARSIADLGSLYNRDQCHHHVSQHHRHKSNSDEVFLQENGVRSGNLEKLNYNQGNNLSSTRSWTVENLFDCPDLASVGTNRCHAEPSQPNQAIRDSPRRSKTAPQASQDMVQNRSKQSTSNNAHVPYGPGHSRQQAEPQAMRRSKSEGTGLNSSFSLSRRATLMSVGGDSMKRSRDLSRLLTPSKSSMHDAELASEGRRSRRGSRPSTAGSEYPHENDRTPRKIVKEPETNVASLEGAKPASKKRVELDLLLESSLIVEGGFLQGRIEVKVPDHKQLSCKKINDGEVWLGEPKVRIVGFEELSVNDSRHVFYHYPVKIPMTTKSATKKTQAARNMLSILEEPVDEEGFVQSRAGLHAYPFQIRLPIGQGAKGIWKGKQGTVRYIVIGSGGGRSIAHFYRHIDLYPYFDPIKTLACAPKPLKVTTSKGLFMGGQGKVHLTAKVHRSVWVAGQRCHVDVHVGNDGTKKIKSLTLALIRTTTVFRSKEPLSDSDTESSSEQRKAPKHPEFCSTQTTKKKIAESTLTMGKKGHQGIVTAKGLWMGVDEGEEVAFSHFLMIPLEALTITRGRHLEVSYTIKVSVGGSLSSDVSVDVPIQVIDFVSIDPPPGHLVHSQEQDSAKHLQPGTNDASDQDELQLFLGSSRFPDEYAQSSDTEIVNCIPSKADTSSASLNTENIGLTISEFPAPPISLMTPEKQRLPRRPLPNPSASNQNIPPSRGRFVSQKYETVDPRRDPRTFYENSTVIPREHPPKSHAMVYMTSNSSNDSSSSGVSVQPFLMENKVRRI
ncbi:uncharacterized protein MELLADRAFT_86243 [Melampsora larici-populina 98AG31]|uniref:Arrestin C-terminal-like domain-containing protein n=1 Tax=Melampsora larici-populina (strain 98AG31 / pathotype 3-4-7) TaxID=747676 RepID=F4RL24_MELLP|nr:uncharacterized protein MELLADRAFT_86243 [Melampsora larici-populina 98AG31]EGG06939.1 hypothetical protein MELLADRAFT_86243 [Melampsora larici-populina 98AG31]